MANPTHVLVLLLPLVLLLFPAGAQVPANETFRYVNEGEFGPYITEYDASYRTTPIFGHPFQLMWYNTTPGQFYLGLRMGVSRSESVRRWVWDANRGRPVGEGATLTFGRDGNLVLAEADGRVVWSTGTANKGAVGLNLLETGNLVVYDKNNRFLWQSFDHPTDTLLVGQSLYVGGPTRLVSRRSAADNSDGAYSLVLESKGPNLFYTPAGSSKRLQYSKYPYEVSENVTKSTFEAGEDEGTATRLWMNYLFGIVRPKYNATLSFMRVAVDGNLEVYTYYDPVDWGAWERTFVFFSESGQLPGCALPERCGSLGACEDDMCVACPTREGLLGWTRGCRPPALGARCTASVGYTKVVGVESFLPTFNKGLKVKVGECERRCTADCKCLGFFYYRESSQCWLAPLLGSLAKVSNSSHVAYIKYVK